MRNLKRALSLALASVMLLGMMVVGSSAASYPDVDDNDNVEAIEVLNAVKVMIGDHGSFNPDKAVNRHEMAVIMAKLVLGNEAADNYVGSHPFTDVYPWADKYVAACYENGLVAGTSKTTFGGNQPLTAIQAAAMMLRALGYEKLSEGASDWRTPVAAKANQIRLFSGVVSSPNVQLTRNQVAQLALNTLEADVVVTTSGANINLGEIGTITTDVRYEKVEVKSTAPQYDGENDGVQQLCEKLYGNDLQLLPTQEDNYGRPGLGWTYKTNDIIALRAETPVLTYTDDVSVKDAKKDLKSYDVDDVTPVVDGTDGSLCADADALATAINAAAGKGVTVTVYADDSKAITDVVVINTYFGQVTKVSEKDGETTATVSRKAGPVNSAKTFETEAFEKDDYVIYTVGSEGIESMAAAESLDGEITATSGTSYLRLEGTKYDYNKNADAEDVAGVEDVELGDATIYLDADGYVIYVGKVEAAAKQYFYVKGADLYMSEISVKAVFADGTTEVVTISGDTYVKATIGGSSPNWTVSDVEFNSKKDDGEGFDTKLSDASYDNVRDLLAKEMIGNVFSYSESDKEYKVSDLGDAGDTVASTDLEKGNNAIDTGVTANNNTVYVMTSDGKTYTGYRNLPSMDNAKLVYVEDEDNAGIATLVFVVSGDEQDDENAFWFYVADEDKFEATKDGNDTIYTLTATYKNGEQEDVVVSADVKDDIDAPGLYKATKANTKDVVTELGSGAGNAPVALDTMKAEQATYAANGTIILDGTNYTYDSKTVFVYVDGDKVSVGEATDIVKEDPSAEEGDEITWVYIAETDDDDTYYLKVVYVIADEAAGGAPGGHTHIWGAYSLSGGEHVRTCSGAGVCDATDTDKKHSPDTSGSFTTDATKHSKTCAHADCNVLVVEEASHTWAAEDATNHKCSVCAATGAHTYSGSFTDNSGTHERECSVDGCTQKQSHSAATSLAEQQDDNHKDCAICQAITGLS